MTVLTEYIYTALDSIKWKILSNGYFYAETPQLGINAQREHLEEC